MPTTPTTVHARRRRCWLLSLVEPSQTFVSLYYDSHKSGQLSQELEILSRAKVLNIWWHGCKPCSTHVFYWIVVLFPQVNKIVQHRNAWKLFPKDNHQCNFVYFIISVYIALSINMGQPLFLSISDIWFTYELWTELCLPQIYMLKSAIWLYLETGPFKG